MISDEELKRYSCISNSNLVRELCDELIQLREEKRAPLYCWLADDPEAGCFDESGIAEDIADNLQDDEEATEEILCSTRLPNRHMRVWLTGGEDREVHFEWVENP